MSCARTVATPSTASPIRTNSTYASSTTTSTCVGDLGQEPVQLGLGHRRPGRVVRRADHDDLGAVGDRRRHRVEVVPAVGGHRHLDAAGPGRGDRDRVGTQLVAQAPADGYTLLLGFDGTMVINPHVFAKLPFDTLRDFGLSRSSATLR